MGVNRFCGECRRDIGSAEGYLEFGPGRAYCVGCGTRLLEDLVTRRAAEIQSGKAQPEGIGSKTGIS